ncbi:Herc4 [Symbiodinium sp. KB8]|nr:Herc4 [Symbiodinium sp. KB8]
MSADEAAETAKDASIPETEDADEADDLFADYHPGAAEKDLSQSFPEMEDGDDMETFLETELEKSGEDLDLEKELEKEMEELSPAAAEVDVAKSGAAKPTMAQDGDDTATLETELEKRGEDLGLDKELEKVMEAAMRGPDEESDLEKELERVMEEELKMDEDLRTPSKEARPAAEKESPPKASPPKAPKEKDVDETRFTLDKDGNRLHKWKVDYAARAGGGRAMCRDSQCLERCEQAGVAVIEKGALRIGRRVLNKEGRPLTFTRSVRNAGVHPDAFPSTVTAGVSISNLASPGEYLYEDTAPLLYGWGRNVYSVVGLGEEVRSANVPTHIRCPDLEEVACGHSHTLFLRKTPGLGPGGDVYGCGLGNRGRQGYRNPDADDDDTPEVEDIWYVPTPKPIPIKKGVAIVRIVCGSDHSMVLDMHGLIYAWGQNGSGQCGVGRVGDVLSAEPVVMPSIKGGQVLVAHMAAGSQHSMFVSAKDSKMGSGKVYVWGCNAEGRLGLGQDEDQLVPVVVDALQTTKVALSAAGEAHTGVVDMNGCLWMWGLGSYGRLGLGEPIDVPLPRRIPIPEELPATRLCDAGPGKSKDAMVRKQCIAQGIGLHRNITQVMQLALGSFHSVALVGYGEALGNKVGGGVSPTPLVVGRAQVLQIAAGPYHTLDVLMEDGELISFGQGSSGRLGTGASKNHKLPVKLPGAHGFATKLRNTDRSAEKASQPRSPSNAQKRLWGSANGLFRTLEDPSERSMKRTAGTSAMGNGRQGWEIAQLKCCSSQRLYTWGSGARGQLGTGSLQAVRFPSGRLVRSIACGREHCVAVTYDGNAYAWGKGDKAWLPLGLVQGVADVLVCAAGEDHTGAICRGEDDNELRPYMWGSSEMGKLGVGAVGLSSTDSPPVVVKDSLKHGPPSRQLSKHSCEMPRALPCIDLWYPNLRRFQCILQVPVALSCGQYHTAVVCALRGDSEDLSEDRIAGRALALAEDGLTSIRLAFAFLGYHRGLRAHVFSIQPLKLHFKPVAGFHVLCQFQAGVWTFGGGWYGRLGHNNMENQFEPKLVQSLLARVRSVHCGALSYEKGVINDNGEPAGDLWVWGRGRCIGEHEHAKVPIKFMQIDGQPKDRDESTRLFQATSDLTNMIVTSAGLVYAWGDNRSGQIGLDGGRKVQLWYSYFIFRQAIFQILTNLAQLCIGDVLLRRNLPQPPILMSAGPAHMVTYGRNKVMMAWGNQSCGRLGLQEKKMEKVIFKPRVVRAEWASIEAMGGTEAEEEGGDKKKVTAAALATLGDESISKALDSESAISEGSSHGEFGEEDAGDTKANLLHAFTSGQKVQRFSTMQTMLKEEPDSNKTGGSLHKHTKAVGVMLALYELKKMVVSAVEDLVTVTEKERRVAMFQERVQKGIDHLNGVLQGPVQHERERDGLDAALMQKLPAYQELFSVLHLQVSYLATLSMTIKDEEASEVFVKVVCAIFADLHDARIRNLFVLLMQMMVFKELEQSKHIDDVFLPASRTFKLFSFFALHEVHFDSVVQPLMDCHRMDEQNQPLTFMGLVTYKTLERGQTWSLDFNDYLKSPSIAAKLKALRRNGKSALRNLELNLELSAPVVVLRAWDPEFDDSGDSGSLHFFQLVMVGFPTNCDPLHSLLLDRGLLEFLQELEAFYDFFKVDVACTNVQQIASRSKGELLTSRVAASAALPSSLGCEKIVPFQNLACKAATKQTSVNAIPFLRRHRKVCFASAEVVSAISRLHLPASFWSFLAFCRETIKDRPCSAAFCQGVDLESNGTDLFRRQAKLSSEVQSSLLHRASKEDEAGTEVGGDPRVELQMCEPLFRLLISGIVGEPGLGADTSAMRRQILPVLSHPKKYGGREVGLWRCEKGNFDGDVLFNLRAVVAAFAGPEVLRFILERLMTGGDEPDTIVTVQTFLSHYDRVPTSIYVSTSQLVLFQNMILNNVNKIRLTSGDPLDEAAKKVGPWSEEFVKEAKGKADKGLEVLYRLEIQHRFFFTDRSMTVCPASKCTVPRRLSSAAGSESQRADEGDVSQNVDVIRTLKEDNPHKVLEDLFRHLPPLTATNFQDLQTEFEALLAQFAAAENDFWEKKLSQGLAAVGDLIDTETSPEEVLDTMASVILARNRHSRYLQSVLAGLSQLGAARDRHGEEIRRPTRILEAAKAESTILRGSEINFLIRKQDARVRTKTGNKVLRLRLADLVEKGQVLSCYSELDTVQEHVYLTLWSSDSDVIVHVGLLDDDGFLLEFVKEFPILESMIKQVALADRNATIGLPPEGPVLMKWKSMELASILKSVPPADCAVSEADASDLRSSPDHSLPEKRSRDVEALSHLWNSCLLDGGDLSDVSPLVRITTPKKQEVINSSQIQKRSVAWKHVLLLEDAQNTRIIESTEDLEGFELLRPEDRT